MAANSNTYDICIIGAGIAGLYVATEMLKAQPKLRLCIADKYKFLGGRAITYRADISGVQYQWEEGAARISKRHHIMMGLLRKYKLGMIPIYGETLYKESGAYPVEQQLFNDIMPSVFEPLKELDESILDKTTIDSLLKSTMGAKEAAALCIRYPYRAELNVLRADIGLDLFANEFGPKEPYVVCKEGLGELITRMVADVEARKGVVLLQHQLIEMADSDRAIFKKGAPSEGDSRPDVEIAADCFVFALPSEALKRISQFTKWPVLKRIVMRPLLRVYGVFPLDSNGKAWFEGMPKFVTAQAPRFIIPNNAKNGSIQMSYTDSEDAEVLMKILKESGEEGLKKKLIDDLRLLFQGVYIIPDPLFIKSHLWKEGTSYWLPGEYDPTEESKKCLHPFPKEHSNWYVCGESYSVRQCWMEGAVEHAKLVIDILRKRV